MGAFSGNVNKTVFLSASGVQCSNTGNTNETTVKTVTIPAGTFQPNSVLIIRALWSVNNDASAKTLRIKVAGVLFMQAPMASVASLHSYTAIHNRNSLSSQVAAVSTTPVFFAGTSGTVATATIDTSASVDITFTVTLTDGTDTGSLEAYQIEVINP